MRNINASMAGMALVFLLVGCGGDGTEAAPDGAGVDATQTTPPVSATANDGSPTASLPADSGSTGEAVPDSSASPSDEMSDPGSAGAESAASPGASVLGPDKKGQKLGLSDFFNPSGPWTENRYDVADETGVSGMASDIEFCGIRDYDDSGKLEMRLGNNFDSMSFKVGQSNTSEASDQTLVVRVAGNNKQVDIWRIPFNEIQEFSFPVEDINALTIQFYLDDEVENCRQSGSVQAVMYDVELQ
jgi:hypothetical protein